MPTHGKVSSASSPRTDSHWSEKNEGISVFASDFLISRFLRALGPDTTFVVAMFAYVLVPWLWSLHDRTVDLTPALRGLTSPENNYIYVLPFLFGAVAYYQRESIFLVPRLIARGVLSAPGEAQSGPGSYDATVAAVDRIVARISADWLSRLARPGPLLVALIVPSMFLLNGVPPASRPVWLQAIVDSGPHTNTWLFEPHRIRPVAFYFSFVFHGMGLAALTAWAISHLRAARLIGRLLDPDSGLRIDLRIFHPDDCMGLRPVSDLVRNSAIVLVLISLTVFLWSAGFLLNSGMTILSDAGFRAAWAFYLVFAPVLFFAPLASARRRMWILKEETLAALGRQLRSAEDAKDLDAMAATYQRALNASVWPFTWITVSSFFASLGVPLLITALSELVGRLLGAK